MSRMSGEAQPRHRFARFVTLHADTAAIRVWPWAGQAEMRG
jgi:hypothetical protein